MIGWRNYQKRPFAALWVKVLPHSVRQDDFTFGDREIDSSLRSEWNIDSTFYSERSEESELNYPWFQVMLTKEASFTQSAAMGQSKR